MMSAAVIRGQPLRAGQQRRAAAGRRSAVQTQALFGFLAPPKAKASNSRAQELVSDLLELTERTSGGLNASGAKREQIAELVDELQAFCPRTPLRNPLLYGDYEVVYTSRPTAAGGPYRTLPGRTVFPGQRLLQSIVEPNVLINTVEYKALGFVPGRVVQEGEITPVSNDTFELKFANDGVRGGPVSRQLQVVYLDDRVRVARSIPGNDAEGAIFVFKRLGVEEEEEEVYEEEEEEEAPAPKRGGFSFGTRRIKAQAVEEEEEEEEAPAPKRGGFSFGTRRMKAQAEEEEEEEAPRGRRGFGTQMLGRKSEGLATMAERRYAQQQGSRGGSQSTGTQARKSREELAEERAAARAAAEEERQRQREAAAAAKAAAEEERRAAREQQEAERARQAELRVQAKEQLAALQAEAAEAAEEAKEAAAEVKEAEKAASDLLRQAGQARGLIDQAEQATVAALQQVQALKDAEAEAAASAADARALITQLTRGRK